ncbi:MAG: phosphoribosylformylglycinamidine cyclo-ligase [Ignavibacteriaceae bacterium]|nr:phosphoribosylformylglycinamidine cyclo-ligase [Ignavibacteriaceae bacterium]
MSETYKNSGVDIEAGDEAVKKIKDYARSTFNKNVLSDIGLFGGFYELDLSGYKNPVLVSSVDGVGTKLKVAISMGRHSSIGQDLVNHCVNDIAVCGAKPLFFLDYLAFGRLKPEIASDIVKGFSVACKENGCVLIGGETAEMPGLYDESDYDLSGTIVGIVDKSKVIKGDKISKGDILIGFKSNGLHTNGYSLARKVLLESFKLNEQPAGLKQTLGEELLSIHKSYLKLIELLISRLEIKGFSHITGGGIVGNTNRILPEERKLKIDWNSWEVPEIFKLIQRTGKIENEEMKKVFNLGIGLIAIASPEIADETLRLASTLNEEGILIGEVL